jgi:Zn-dependent M28 family amino/carboxypeptidase
MKLKNLLMLAVAGIFLSNCNSVERDIDKALADITVESIQKHIEFLSDDALMGRAPATEGEEMTVNYIISEFERMGLKPGMGDGKWIQEVPVIGQTTDRNTSLRITRGGRQVLNIPYFTDLMVSPALDQEQVSIRNAEMVYVGYGIVAPEENWDDYKGLDVRGKILVMKNSNPMGLEDGFRGNNRLYYGRWSYKYEIAQELGALGVLIIHTTPTAGYPWAVVANSFGRERFTLKPEGASDAVTEMSGWLSSRASMQLFDAAGLDLAELMNAADSPDFTPVSLGNLRASIDLKATYKELVAKNVVGIVEGNDPIYKDEYIVFSGHHDQLGVGAPVDGDSIYNGAHDNASGTSAVLNLAEAFNKIQPHLKRSMMFALVGAEESGLLGSKYFAQNLPVPAGRISANVNLDMINVYGLTRDIVSIGLGRTSMDAIVEEEAAKTDRVIVPDQFPDQGFFYRSDHFSFARAGIPALYLNPGVEYVGKPDNYQEEYVGPEMSRRYHTVFDEIHDGWDLSGAVRDMHMVFRVAYRINQADALMSWTPGDEFEATRLQSIAELE